MVVLENKLPSSGLKIEYLTHIDISTLSHSELHTVSLCSDAAFNLCHIHDVVMPQIDWTVFNESDGSHRQTYTHLHHTPQSPDSSIVGHRHRLLHNSRPNIALNFDDDSIIRTLKHLIASNGIENSLDNQLHIVPYDHSVVFGYWKFTNTKWNWCS